MSDLVNDWLLPLIALIGIVLAFMVVIEREFDAVEIDAENTPGLHRHVFD